MTGKGIGTGLFAGSGFGVLLSQWLTWQADAAVAVRPSLGDVGLLTALLTGHGTDWVFYHHPSVAGALLVAVLALIGIIIGGLFS